MAVGEAAVAVGLGVAVAVGPVLGIGELVAESVGVLVPDALVAGGDAAGLAVTVDVEAAEGDGVVEVEVATGNGMVVGDAV